jgi:hypothetical protein
MKTDPISAATAYRMALDTISKAGSLATAVHIAQQALRHTFTPPEEGQISIDSGYGHRTKQPFVIFTLANPSESANPTIQMTSAQARTQAHYILEAADAAESDGFIVEWLRDKADLTEPQLGAMLAEFRAFREQHRSKE